MPIHVGDDHLGVEIHMLQKPRGFHNVPQLCLAPRATHLVVAQRRRQSVGFAVKTGLLLAKPLELLAKRTHLPFAPFFDLRDLLLQGVKILLHGRERRQYLALFLQFPLVFGLLAFRFGRGTLTLSLHSFLFGPLGLRELRFEIGQLLGQPFRLRAVLGHRRGQFADFLPISFDLRFRLVKISGFRITGHFLPFGTARKKAGRGSKRSHNHQKNHHKHRIVEHMFYITA